MLSPTLLELLRDWYRVARPQGWLKATSTKGSLPALERRHANVLQKLTVLDTARPDDDLLREGQAEQYVEEREQPRDGLHQVVPDT
jgi:hypothetical protein